MRDYRGSSKKLPSDWRTKSSCQKNRQAYNCGANTGTLFTLSVFFPYVKLRTTNPFSRGFLLCQTEDQHSHSYSVLTESFKHCQGFQWDCLFDLHHRRETTSTIWYVVQLILLYCQYLPKFSRKCFNCILQFYQLIWSVLCKGFMLLQSIKVSYYSEKSFFYLLTVFISH